MSESPVPGAVLAAVVGASALGLLLPPSRAILSLPIGLALLLILFAYYGGGPRSTFHSLAFGAAAGLALVVASEPLLPMLPPGVLIGMSPYLLVWVIASFVLFLVDRARAGAPSPAPQGSISLSAFTPPAPEPAPHADPYQPRLVRDEPQPAPPPSPALAQPAPPPPAAPPAQAAPEPSQIAPAPIKRGKQVNIYVNLVGEGMVMLRPVRAEHLGRDFYHILDVMPDNERWEFGPGQVVRCQKKNLSSGKALVAVEEAPRAQ